MSGALGRLRAQKQQTKTNPFTAKAKAKSNGKPKKGGLAALRAKREAEAKKRDTAQQGIRYHNVVNHGSYWTVDVSSGDETVTFHNKFGAWFTDVEDREGHMKEPRTFEIAMGINERWRRELKARGIPTPEEARAAKEEAQKKTKNVKKEDTPSAPKQNGAPATPKSAKSSSSDTAPKANPWSTKSKKRAADTPATGRASRTRRRK